MKRQLRQLLVSLLDECFGFYIFFLLFFPSEVDDSQKDGYKFITTGVAKGEGGHAPPPLIGE